MKQRTNEWWWYVHYQQNSYSYLIFTYIDKQMYVCVCFNNTYIWVRVSSFFRWMEDWMHYYSLDCNPGYCGKFVVSFLLLLKTLNTWNSSMTSINPFFVVVVFLFYLFKILSYIRSLKEKKNEKKEVSYSRERKREWKITFNRLSGRWMIFR